MADPTSATTLVVAATVMDAGFNMDMLRLTVSTSGTLLQAPVVANDNAPIPSGGISELVAGLVPGQEFALIGAGSGILDTIGTDIATNDAGDIISLSPGTLVVLSGSASNPNVTLNLITNFGSVDVGVTVAGSNVQGFSTSGAQTFAKELVDLGGGRLLIVFVSDGGEVIASGSQTDGVYAQVYNMNTGNIEGNATLVLNRGLGNNDPDLSAITISADLMVDGRVALGLGYLRA